MMDIINISDNEITYLIEKGILDRSDIVHPFQFGLLGQHLPKQPSLIKRMGITISPKVYQWLKTTVRNSSKIKAKQHIENIDNYLDNFCIDEDAKKAYLSGLLTEYHRKIGDDLYAVYKNESDWKHATFSAFTKEEYIELADTGNIAKLKENEHIKAWIEIETTEEFIDFIKEKFKEICTDKSTRKPKRELSYTWQSNPDEELPELHKKMIEAGLIAPDTDIQNLIKVFTGQPLDEITPVRWLKTQKLLAYFISKVTNKLDDLNRYWQIAETCFYPANNLKQTHQNNQQLDEHGRPKGHQLVDALFE